MISWKVEKTNRLLAEVKNKFLGRYTTKAIRWSIDHNRCFVNQTVERFGSVVVKKGDTIAVRIETPPAPILEPERILHQDPHLLVYDKPPLMTSEQLAALTQCLLVHRLDRDTSGVILLAKTAEAQRTLERQFRQRLVTKEYLAIVEGDPGEKGTIIGKMAPIRRKEGAVVWGMTTTGLPSQTLWTRLENRGKISCLQCTPRTGRTHQIRVHLAHLGYPILGDPVYGSRRPSSSLRPLLHSHRLTFTHPVNGNPLMIFAPPPYDFLTLNFLYFNVSLT